LLQSFPDEYFNQRRDDENEKHHGDEEYGE